MKTLLKIVGYIALFAIICIIATFISQAAWNNFMAPVLGVRNIDFTEAFWLTVFIGIFKNYSYSNKEK